MVQNLNGIRNFIRKQLNEMNETGYTPIGSDDDPSAPWNDNSKDNDVTDYSIDPQTNQFEVTTNKSENFQMPIIDVLEQFWKKNPGTFEIHDNLFRDNENPDYSIASYVENEHPKAFSDILLDLAERRGLLSGGTPDSM